ncbi:preprotein translocase subunit SecG [soil metagenome]
MEWTLVLLNVLLVLSGFFLIFLILMHKGRGGGLSDMFGGGMSSSLGGSSIAERNLNRITIAMAVIWITAVVGIGILI